MQGLSTGEHRQKQKNRVNIDNLNTNIAVRALISKIDVRCTNSGCSWIGRAPRERKPRGQLPIYVNAVPQWLLWEPTALCTRPAPDCLPLSTVAVRVLQYGSAKMPSRSSCGKLSRKLSAMSASVRREIT